MGVRFIMTCWMELSSFAEMHPRYWSKHQHRRESAQSTAKPFWRYFYPTHRIVERKPPPSASFNSFARPHKLFSLFKAWGLLETNPLIRKLFFMGITWTLLARLPELFSRDEIIQRQRFRLCWIFKNLSVDGSLGNVLNRNFFALLVYEYVEYEKNIKMCWQSLTHCIEQSENWNKVRAHSFNVSSFIALKTFNTL